MSDLGDRIRHIRSEILDKSQAEFADLLGYKSDTSIGKIERGENEPSIEILNKIADIAKLPVEWVMTGNPLFKTKEAVEAYRKYKESAARISDRAAERLGEYTSHTGTHVPNRGEYACRSED